MNREKMPVSERAKQFMPFAALHGYYDLVKRKEEKPSEREDMTEERAEKLSEAAEREHHSGRRQSAFAAQAPSRTKSAGIGGQDAPCGECS